MKLLPICSSSKGNCVFVGNRESGIAIDVGCSFKSFKSGLALAGIELSAVKAVLITHSHIDHVKGLLTLTKNTRIPLYGSEETLDYILHNNLIDPAADMFTLDRLKELPFNAEITSFKTPHDCEGSVGYRVDLPSGRLGFATDLGNVTAEVRENMLGCRTVFLEANYQPELLKKNLRYPDYLKRRIASDNGHLSNPDSANFCAELVKRGTINFMLGHLSQENNTPETAFEAAKARMESAGAKYERDFTLSVAPVNNLNGEYIKI